ncbi:DNA replication licensing factor mcm2 [Taphrina deformans PYCC 5710]|uniref:DNA replication licensing factor MCM2 n=1 Tax=Taphrina deformans (strain PYCC 5710 / ATCC 11124 / CBS 356.35 / IMI 108563 / JCM 9778 / NBRC 8474) TaxID=1097556 RepID=R4XGD9_TAPDE|nr:DNA replication licensing factor mcm2 [Taphrina deformans PYCC 5710]|eukprot:CCG83554.1 DNA replication licensing factor mcm2 [Taphrina deformans PYCC 5710]
MTFLNPLRVRLINSVGSSLPPSSPPQPFSDFDDVDEEPLIADEIPDLEEEEEGEDLFGPSMERDYNQNLAEDNYDPDDIDDEQEFGEMTAAERRAVDARLARRDREIARAQGRQPAAFLQGDSDDEMDLGTTRRRRHQYDEDIDDAGDAIDDEMSGEAIADMKADTISDWIAVDQVRRAIAREFKKFLLEYTDMSGTSVYGNRIRTLGEVNSESLEINYAHLAESKGTLAYFLAAAPEEMLRIFDMVAMDATLLFYPDYERIHSEIHVRVTDLPKTFTLRELRQIHLNGLVKVSGVVTRRTGVNPQLKYVKFNCVKCGEILGPFYQDAVSEVKISYCQNCQSRGPFTVNSEKTIYRNYQTMVLQESPGTVPAGRLPRSRKVVLLWDLVDSAKPGEEVEITGIYRNQFDASLNSKNGFPVFSTVIEANHVSKAHDQFAAFRLTEQDEKSIRQLSKNPDIINKIIASIAPSIYGHKDIKTAIALSLFGGVPKDINGKHRIRGDINVLLLGDPGTAKSQFLKYVEKTAHRAVFTTGQGASAVGLTASVRKDPITSEWTLEGGALVLADKGTCLIDEFDKMNDQDRTSIHEAMEQQSISVSKAGIVTSLQARCAIMAAANPIGGRYNATIPFSQNVELTEPILSRFDILCVVKDTVDPAVDERLARFVVGSHLRSHPKYNADEDSIIASSNTAAEDVDIEPIDQDLLKKYIVYAREHTRPKLHQMDTDKVSKLYSDMRRESLKTGSFPITVRHLESIIRMSESYAKMQLSEFVRQRHIDEAIRVTIDSFIGANKLSVKRSLGKAFARYTLPRQARE